MKDISIQKLEKQHIHQASILIANLHDTIITKRKDIFRDNKEDWEEYLMQSINSNDYVSLVAIKESDIVGVCVAQVKHCGDGKETNIRDILFIDYITVDKNYRRCNIGSKLLDEMKSIAKNIGVSSLELNVWGFNKEAIEFYNKNDMTQKRIVYEYFIDKE